MTATKQRPAVLLCDVGDTLVTWNRYDRAAGLDSLYQWCDHPERYDRDALIATGEKLDEDMERRAAVSLLEFRQADFLRSVFATIGIGLEENDDVIETRYWANALGFSPEPGVAAALNRIHSAGVRLGIISNTIFGPAAIEYELEQHHIAHYFERPILTSARYGMRKPHPSIFTAALGLFGTSPNEAWYIGNSKFFDVGGAQAAGITAVWYNTGAPAAGMLAEGVLGEPDRDPTPDIEVNSWDQLASFVDDL